MWAYECACSEGSLSLIAEATPDMRCSRCNHNVHKCPNQKSGSFWRVGNQYHRHHQGQCSDSQINTPSLTPQPSDVPFHYVSLTPCRSPGPRPPPSPSLAYGYRLTSLRPASTLSCLEIKVSTKILHKQKRIRVCSRI